MKRKVCLAGALLIAFTAFGEEPKQPAMDAATQAMMAAGTPGEPHKQLAQFAGNWDTSITIWMAPGAEPLTSNGTSENKLLMGGRYLEQRFRGEFAGMPFEGIGYTGYDNVKKRYWGTWMDNMSTWSTMATGETSDGKTWTFTGTTPDPLTGGDMKVEEKLTVIDADHHRMEMWMPAPDGKMFKSMEIAYSRKK